MDKNTLLAGAVAMTTVLFAGCGATAPKTTAPSITSHAVAKPKDVGQTRATHQPPSLPKPTEVSSNVPALIRNAMAQLEGHTFVPLYAPTVYPGSAHTPLPVSAQGYTSTSTPPHYRVLFYRGGQTIGEYSVSQWPSRSAAVRMAAGWASLPAFPAIPGGAQGVPLGNGITASVARVTGPPKETDAILWQEGRWQMGVFYAPNANPQAMVIAQRIVAYCHQEFLPVPETRGWLAVSLVGQTGQTAVSKVVWEQNNLVIETGSNGPWNSNLSGGYLSAVEMAVQMRPY